MKFQYCLTLSLLAVLAANTNAQVRTARDYTRSNWKAKNVVGKKLIGKPFETILRSVQYDSSKRAGGSLWLFKKGNLVLTISDKGQRDGIIRSIDIYSPNVTTPEGLRVGMSIPELARRYKNIELESYNGERLFPEEIQLPSSTGEPCDICIGLDVESGDGRKLAIGPLKDVANTTTSFRKVGRVVSIAIYKWK